MLYVFYVNIGRMLNFDMSVALSPVENLKEIIERLHGIPKKNIVLLANDGKMLDSNVQVSYYAAGTSTSPIFMFSTGDVKFPPLLTSTKDDLNIRKYVGRSIELPAVYDTVVKRADLAFRMHSIAQEAENICERLVHEQRLQHQGWITAVANMEDLTRKFYSRFGKFCKLFDKHLQQRPSYLKQLTTFPDDLSKLSRIPVLPGLISLAKTEFLKLHDFFSTSANQQQSALMFSTNTSVGSVIEASDSVGAWSYADANSNDETIYSSLASHNKKLNEEQMSQTPHRLNLLQWIISKENHNTLRDVSDGCFQGLATFNEHVYEKLKTDIQSAIKLVKQSDFKVIGGLSDRLCKLEGFNNKIKSLAKDQKEFSNSFQQNQLRTAGSKNNSILKDLCTSHKSQLLMMLQNHKMICEHKYCIAKSKDELNSNLNARMKRIVYLENLMNEFDNRLLFYHRCLKRSEQHLHIIEQIHQAPTMYVAAVAEVMRRKIFSTEFHLWASKLTKDFDFIHKKEIKRRQEFNKNFDGHFLNILFPGLKDMPPTFINKTPLIFDARLPNITKSDINMLTTYMPEVASQVQLLDMEPVIHFFVSHSGTDQQERFEELLAEKQERYEKDFQQILDEDEQSASGNLPLNASLSELHKEAFKTEHEDTEEESDTYSDAEYEEIPLDNREPMVTLPDGNLKSCKNAITNYLNIEEAMSNLTFSEEFFSQQKYLQSDSQTFIDSFSEQFNEPAIELQQEEEQNNEISYMKIKCATMEAQLEELKEKCKSYSAEKELAILEATEKLRDEYEAKLESLHQDFNLEINSLNENIIEKHIHKTILSQLCRELKLDAKKERASTSKTDTPPFIWELQFPKGHNSEDGWDKENTEIIKSHFSEKSERLVMEIPFHFLRSPICGQIPVKNPISNASSNLVIVLRSCSIGDLVLVVWSMLREHFMVAQFCETLHFVHEDSFPAMNLRLPQAYRESSPRPFYAIGRVVEKKFVQIKKDDNPYRLRKGTKFYDIKLANFNSP